MTITLEENRAIEKKAISSLDWHLMQDVLVYGSLFDRLANAETDEEAEAIAKQMQGLEKEKLPLMYADAREYHFGLKDVLGLIDAKIKRLQEAEAAFEKVLARHDDAIHKTMTMMGSTKIQLQEGSFTRRMSGNPPVEVENEEMIPSEYKSFTVSLDGVQGHAMTEYVQRKFEGVKITASVRKNEVKKALKSAEKVPGARLGKETESLLVK